MGQHPLVILTHVDELTGLTGLAQTLVFFDVDFANVLLGFVYKLKKAGAVMLYGCTHNIQLSGRLRNAFDSGPDGGQLLFDALVATVHVIDAVNDRFALGD